MSNNPVEQLDELSRLLKRARELGIGKNYRETLELYQSAISKTLVVNTLAETELVHEATLIKGLNISLNDDFSLARVSDPKAGSLALVAATCHEAANFAIKENFNFDAYSIIEIIKSRRLFNELARLQFSERVPSIAEAIVLGELTTGEIEHIFSIETKAAALLCFYLSPQVRELYVFIFCGTADEWHCKRSLVLNKQKTAELNSGVTNYIRNIQNEDFEHAKKDLQRVLGMLGTGLRRPLRKLKEMNIKKILFAPHCILHQLPLHAIPLDYGGENDCLLAHFESITFTPSLLFYSLVISDKDSNSWTGRVLGNFDLKNLNYGSAGLISFSRLFGDLRPQVVVNPFRANINDRVNGSTFLHFDCHGLSYEDDFMNNRVVLYDGHLTFREVLQDFDCRNMCLVFLNACETGLNLNPDTLLDEYYGLDGAFLAKGALTAISTLAPVFDIAAFLISLRFYLNIRSEHVAISTALQRAQLWLRDGEWKTDPLVEKIVHILGENYDNEYVGEKANECALLLEKFLQSAADDFFRHEFFWCQWKCSGFGENVS